MKMLISIPLFLTLITSCASYDPKEDIESLLEIELPECYVEVENPKKEDSQALEVFELKFEAECLDELLDSISGHIPNAYCGASAVRELTMSYCTRDESARMTLNTVSGVLHFEKLK